MRPAFEGPGGGLRVGEKPARKCGEDRHAMLPTEEGDVKTEGRGSGGEGCAPEGAEGSAPADECRSPEGAEGTYNPVRGDS